MAVMKIYRMGDDVLRKKAHEVKEINRRTVALIKDMAETMYAADGCGLAAPQVGVLRRIVVIDVGEGLVELINPVILEASGHQEGPEGCLSLPGRQGVVTRPMKVTVKAQDRHGKPIQITGEGFFARALCHELDHLEGILFKAKASRMIDPSELETEEENEE